MNKLVAGAKQLALFLGVEGCEDHSQYMSDPDRPGKISELQIPGEFLSDVGTSVQSLVLWSKYGCNVFDVGDGLLAGLLLTTPTDSPGLPHLPFPSFVIRISPGFVPFPSVASDTPGSPEWLTYIHVSYLSNLLVTGGEANVNVLRIASMCERDSANTICDTVNEKLFTNAQEYLKYDFSYTWGDSEVVDPAASVADKAAFRIVFNLLSWLESVGGMASQRQADQVLARMSRGKGKPRPRRWILGSEIEIAPEIVEAARQSGAGRGGRWHVMRRHVVRGHLRNQACGRGRQERKILWIAPYWKGPEGGAVLDHVYKVAEKLRRE